MRLTRLLALSLLAALAFSACGTGSPTAGTTPAYGPAGSYRNCQSQSQSPAPSRTPTPLPTIGVDPAALRASASRSGRLLPGRPADLFTSQAAQFNANNQWGIMVTPSGYGDYTSLFDAMNTALDAGKAPDLVAALPEQTLAWEALGKVVDLQPYLGDPQWGLGTDAIADIPAIFLGAG